MIYNVFQRFKTMKFFILPAVLTLTLTNCTIGAYEGGTLHRISSRRLSVRNPQLRTCVFDPQYRIVHFPMYHSPPGGHYTRQVIEEVAQSQFQLLHTILDYNRSPSRELSVFDENITSDNYNESYLQLISLRGPKNYSYTKLDGRQFFMGEHLNKAKQLFQRTGFPGFYENLSTQQKDFLFHTGASLTLYLLGEIPKIHKVISPASFSIVKAELLGPNGILRLEGNDHVLFDKRELELRKEVLGFLQRNNNPRTLILIAYGAKHDFSNEFSRYPFQSGHNFCLKWLDSSRQTPSVLP